MSAGAVVSRPFHPRQIGNMRLWLDPAAISGSTWPDISGNGLNATLVNSPTVGTHSSGRAQVSFNGTTQYAEIADNALLDFALADSFTFVIVSQHASFATNDVLVAKKAGRTSGSAGYMLRNGGSTAAQPVFHICDATNQVNSTTPTAGPHRSTGVLQMQTMVADRAADQVRSYIGTTAVLTQTDTMTGTSANTQPFRVACDSSGADFTAMDVIAVLVYAQALTEWEINLLNQYFTGAASTVVTVDPTSVALNSDSAWSWWTKPRAVEMEGALYACVNCSDRVALRYISAGGTETEIDLGDSPEEDHNNGALIVRANKPIVAIWNLHNDDTKIRVRRSIDPPSSSRIPTFGPEQVIETDTTTSYLAAYVDSNNDLWCFFRGGLRAWGFIKSTDWDDLTKPATWTPYRRLFDRGTSGQLYMGSGLDSDGDTLRVALANHPDSLTGTPSVYYAEITLSTGAMVSSGGSIGNANSLASPVTTTTLEVVEALTEPDSAWVYECGEDSSGRPVVVYMTCDDTDASTRVATAMYRYATKDSGTWTAYDIVAAGDEFYTHYWGGAQLGDGDGNTVYLARESAGTWYVDKKVTADRGASWTTTNLVSDGSNILNRVWAVENGDTYEAVYSKFSSFLIYTSWTGGLEAYP
jgi:hypothetical protein